MRRQPCSSVCAGGELATAAGDRQFEAWVRGRLGSWTSGEIRAFERWLQDESVDEFVPAVRAAWSHKRLEESAHAASGERAI